MYVGGMVGIDINVCRKVERYVYMQIRRYLSKYVGW